MRPMFEGFQADSPSSWLGAGLDTLDLPGALVRGLLAGRPGERVSGDELLRGWGYDDPGAFASTATSMATDPLSYLALLGPVARLLRGAGAVGEGLGAAKAATTSSTCTQASMPAALRNRIGWARKFFPAFMQHSAALFLPH